MRHANEELWLRLRLPGAEGRIEGRRRRTLLLAALKDECVTRMRNCGSVFAFQARKEGSKADVVEHSFLLLFPSIASATAGYEAPRSAARMNSRPGSCSRTL